MILSDIKHIPAQPARVEVVVSLTPEEYERIRTDAAWGHGGSIAEYLKNCALNPQRRGC